MNSCIMKITVHFESLLEAVSALRAVSVHLMRSLFVSPLLEKVLLTVEGLVGSSLCSS